MARYVKRMLRRRVFFCGISCTGDYAANPDNPDFPEDRIIESRIQYYQRKLVDVMLKILYLERYSFELGMSRNLSPELTQFQVVATRRRFWHSAATHDLFPHRVPFPHAIKFFNAV